MFKPTTVTVHYLDLLNGVGGDDKDRHGRGAGDEDGHEDGVGDQETSVLL